MDLILSVLPFAAGIVLKIVVFVVSGGKQKAALEKLEEGHKKKGEASVLTEGQRNVVLAVLNLSTASLTAASTLTTSLVTFLVVALRYNEEWIWGYWLLDLALSTILWFYIKKCKQPYERVWNLKVGTFLLILAGLLDGLGLIPTIVASHRSAPPSNNSEFRLSCSEPSVGATVVRSSDLPLWKREPLCPFLCPCTMNQHWPLSQPVVSRLSPAIAINQSLTPGPFFLSSLSVGPRFESCRTRERIVSVDAAGDVIRSAKRT